jgi:FkbM family methyltransferase
MSSRLLERATIKFWRRIVPRFSVVAGHRRIRVSGNNLKSVVLLTWRDNWKSQIIRQILEVSDGDFIDVGANVGQTLIDFYSVGMARRYIGFEPNPSSYASLRAFTTENSFDSCTILPIGLSDGLHVLNLYSAVGASTDQGASIIPDIRGCRELQPTTILCCRFDDLRDDLKIRSIGLIKIDVEGAELQVLRGMESSLQALRPSVLCEILFADARVDIEKYANNVRQIWRYLEDLQYSVFRIQKHRQDFVELLQVDCFPVRVWTSENSHECDYIFMPNEKMREYSRLIGRAQGI